MFQSYIGVKGNCEVLMSDKLKISNVFYTNELTINELIDDYAKFIANKLFQEGRNLYEQEKEQ